MSFGRITVSLLLVYDRSESNKERENMENKFLPQINMEEVKTLRHFDWIEDSVAIFDDIEDFRIPETPFKLGMCLIAIGLQGEISIRINQKEHCIRTKQLLMLLPDSVISYQRNDPHYEALFIAISPHFLDEMVPKLSEVLPLLFMLKQQPCIPLDDQEFEHLQEYHAYLWSRTRQTDMPYRKEIIRCLLKVLFYDVNGILGKRIVLDAPASRHDVLFREFLQLVGKHFRTERCLEFYACKLSITPKYLSMAVSQSSNITATEWIDNYVISEAKMLLKHSTLSVQEVSNELGFPNQSFFGKFFKRKTGFAPGAYKRS